jgi:hypothetical protein
MLSWAVLALVIPILAFAALRMHPYTLLLFEFPFVVFGFSDWQIAGIRLDPTDLILMTLAVVARSRPLPDVTRARLRPMFAAWVALGLCMSVAYLMAPINQHALSDPARIAYQLYRYCWRPILFYPLMLLFVSNDERRLDGVTSAILIGGTMAASMAIVQGYSGNPAIGPYDGRNALGGGLVAPCVLAVALVAVEHRKRRWQLAVIAAILIARGLLFCGSRGAFVGATAGIALFFGFFILSGTGLTRVLRYAGAGLALAVVMLIANPEILNKTSIQHLLSATGGTSDDNMQWRMQQRWPHFIAMLNESPWVGIGTDQDHSLSRVGNTPHNGYISLALFHGVPAALLYTLFGITSIFRGIRIYSRAGPSAGDRLFALAAAASIAGVMVHNIVETTLMASFTQNIFWSLCALIGCRAVRPPHPTLGTVAATASAPRRPRRPAPRRLRPAQTATPLAPPKPGDAS